MIYSKVFVLIVAVLTVSCSCSQNNKVEINMNNLEDIVKDLYKNGTFSSDYKVITWFSENEELNKKFNLEKGKYEFKTEILFFQKINLEGKDEAFILSQIRPSDFDCQTCSPILQIIIFKKETKDKWILDIKQNFAQIGNWGVAPDFVMEKIGNGKIGFSFRTGITLQGVTQENYELYSKIGNEFKRILNIDGFSMDNSGDCDESEHNCWEFSSEFNFENTANNNGFYNLKVVTKGSKEENGSIVKFEQKKVFVFNGNIYIETSPARADMLAVQ